MKTTPTQSLKALVIGLLFISNTLVAQESKTDSIKPALLKNAIHGNVGIGGLYFTSTAFYERMLPLFPQNSKISSFAKAGFGGAAYWGGQSQYILGQFGILTGTGKNHLEGSVGFIKFLDDFNSGPLSGSIGYRIQKPGGHFILRTGLGWPEALYLGIGASF